MNKERALKILRGHGIYSTAELARLVNTEEGFISPLYFLTRKGVGTHLCTVEKVESEPTSLSLETRRAFYTIQGCDYIFLCLDHKYTKLLAKYREKDDPENAASLMVNDILKKKDSQLC